MDLSGIFGPSMQAGLTGFFQGANAQLLHKQELKEQAAIAELKHTRDVQDAADTAARNFQNDMALRKQMGIDEKDRAISVANIGYNKAVDVEKSKSATAAMKKAFDMMSNKTGVVSIANSTIPGVMRMFGYDPSFTEADAQAMIETAQTTSGVTWDPTMGTYVAYAETTGQAPEQVKANVQQKPADVTAAAAKARVPIAQQMANIADRTSKWEEVVAKGKLKNDTAMVQPKIDALKANATAALIKANKTGEDPFKVMVSLLDPNTKELLFSPNPDVSGPAKERVNGVLDYVKAQQDKSGIADYRKKSGVAKFTRSDYVKTADSLFDDAGGDITVARAEAAKDPMSVYLLVKNRLIANGFPLVASGVSGTKTYKEAKSDIKPGTPEYEKALDKATRAILRETMGITNFSFLSR